MRIGQDCGQRRGLARAELAGRLAEGIARTGLGAELPVRAPFGDIEVNLHDAPLGQDEVDPERQRQLERLAQIAAPAPEEQVLGDLLGDGRAAARFADVVGLLDRVADLLPVDAPMGAEARILRGEITVAGRTGAIRSSGTFERTTRAPVAQRHTISVETGSTTR